MPKKAMPPTTLLPDDQLIDSRHRSSYPYIHLFSTCQAAFVANSIGLARTPIAARFAVGCICR
jgi:hypothetical protein